MRSLQSLGLALLSALIITSTAAAQITVGPVGSGSQFTEIQDAIDASPAGSTIFVAAGNYTRELTIDKAIVIVGDADAASRPVLSIPSAMQMAGVVHLSVRDLPSGARVVISGVDFTITEACPFVFTTDWVNGNSKIVIEDCDGRVILSNCRLDRCKIQSAAGGGPIPSIVQIARARSVLLDECTMGYGLQFSAPQQDAATIAAIDSTVTLSNCSVRGPNLVADATTNLHHAPSALFAVNSTILVSGSQLRGGSGNEKCTSPCGLGCCLDLARTHPNKALAAKDSVIDISGGLGNVIAAGSKACFYSSLNACHAFSGIELSGGCTVWTSVDVVSTPTPGTPVKPPITSTVTDVVVSRPHRAPVLALAPPYASVGASSVLELFSNTSSVNFAFYASEIANPYFVPGFEGSVFVNPNFSVFLNVIGTDMNGLGALNVNVPAFAPLAGLAVHFQCIEVGGNGTLLSNAATLVIQN